MLLTAEYGTRCKRRMRRLPVWALTAIVIVALAPPQVSDAALVPNPGESEVLVSGPIRFVPQGNTVVRESGAGRYRGILEIAPAPQGGLALINELAFEDYLKGIAEVPGRWPREALRAQAIAARTYLLWEMAGGRTGEGKQLGYDICATVACQVYRGLDNEAGPSGAAWAAAVEETRSMAVVFDGKPILARYHSTSGGRTRHNEDVFTSDGPRPYLKAVDSPGDETSPLMRWSTAFSKSRIEEMLSGDKELPLKGSLANLRFTKHPDGSGIPNEVTVIGTGGETTVRAATFSRIISREAKKRWPGEYPPPNPSLPGTRLPDAVPSSNLHFRLDGDQVVVEGTGWGHGVGMSQYGALGMAEAGASAGEILRHYYRGADISRVDEPETVRVAVGSGAPKIAIEGSGEFRIESADGDEIMERALGHFTVLPKSRSSVRLQFPTGWDRPLALSDVGVSTPLIAPDGRVQVASFSVTRPALAALEIRDSRDKLIFKSEEIVVDAGQAQLEWSVVNSSVSRPRAGDYVAVIRVRSPGESAESEVAFAVAEAPGLPDGESRNDLAIVLVPVGVVFLAGAALAIVLARRRSTRE